MSKLESKVALVIGGVDGIGGAISESFVAEGAQVYATSRRGAGNRSQTKTGIPLRSDAT
ncbi:NAD(P)-dependent dehydrogenase (short-subunit alcohol dehydrogenase family) [Rhizobium soli]|uniref:NAD(P)-dependent dehydrogenase (Short-subunit alcohol dehydrogenase family) n=1 Tax=Rhizobium soli TaxID=424798 RepID=A0A7X0MTY5_9HYPH|nr:NAD(P)-dependent dehydrogenase (short-subunit alcohol dehydrogenase family) [Rhizobium soli]